MPATETQSLEARGCWGQGMSHQTRPRKDVWPASGRTASEARGRPPRSTLHYAASPPGAVPLSPSRRDSWGSPREPRLGLRDVLTLGSPKR